MKKIILLLLLSPSFSAFANTINLYADSVHAPFYYGVASGDPTANSVIIWTHITSLQPSETVAYEVASDSLFTALVSNGTFTTKDSLDYTVTIDVGGLLANSTYYYRFKNNNKTSAIGRTRTAPSGTSNEVKFAVISCSSVYSGYFNSYRNIASRDDLNAVIHLGDYIYEDRVLNEEVRFPDNPPALPQNIQDWRTIHKFWLLDPDLRAARQKHPFIQLWDNHDTDGLHFDCLESSEAFMNYVPVRQNPSNYQKIYRKLSYGNLLDVFILDVALWRGIDTISGSDKSYLGNEQFQWFKNAISNSTAKWKVVGSQKMFSTWSVGSTGGIVNSNAWDGFPLERTRVLNVIDSGNINNVVFISGDSHVSLAADVPYTPYDTTTYKKSTGFGSLCVEFAPASISRGNFNEKGLSAFLINTLLETSNLENLHHQYVELTKHGYGIMSFNNDSLHAQYYYCDILVNSNLNELGAALTLYDGENHWKRKDKIQTSIENNESENNPNVVLSKLYPNPTDKDIQFDIALINAEDVNVSIYQIINPKHINHKSTRTLKNITKEHVSFSVAELPAGVYILMVESNSFYKGQLFIKQ